MTDLSGGPFLVFEEKQTAMESQMDGLGGGVWVDESVLLMVPFGCGELFLYSILLHE